MIRAAAVLALTACGTTGGNSVTFDVAAAGPVGGIGGFDNNFGWHVTLDKAHLHVGAIYLDLAVPISGAQSTSCILPGIYTAEELSGIDVDVLSPELQSFPTRGEGTDDEARTGEVWLVGSDINAGTDVDPATGQPTVVASVSGTASNALLAINFSATVTVGSNRAIVSSDPSMPSAHPICKQRIVTPIPIDLAPIQDGTLVLRIDPRLWVQQVDFSGLAPPSAIPDDNSTTASQALFTGIHGPAAFDLSFE